GEHGQQVVHRCRQRGGSEHGEGLILTGAAVGAAGVWVVTGAGRAACRGERERCGGYQEGDEAAARAAPTQRSGVTGAHRASTITVVALTTALARAPTSRPRSRTASADINDTTR